MKLTDFEEFQVELLTKLEERARRKKATVYGQTILGLCTTTTTRQRTKRQFVTRFLTDKRISVLEHQHYLTESVPCYFYPFLIMKISLIGTRFQSVEEIKKKMADLSMTLTCNIDSIGGKYECSGA